MMPLQSGFMGEANQGMAASYYLLTGAGFEMIGQINPIISHVSY